MPRNHLTFLRSLFSESEEQKRKIFRSIKARADSKRKLSEKIADRMTGAFGSMPFLTANALFFLTWIVINTNLIKGVPAFDPFPFMLLTTIVSLEAIILAIFVLVSQNRSLKVDDLREEVDLQVNLIIEKEVTKVMKMLSLLLEKNGIDLSSDPELKKLVRPISEEEIEGKLKKEIF